MNLAAKESSVLEELEQIFNEYRQNIELDFSIITGEESHYKQILHESEGANGTLIIALIYFTGTKPTGLHIHPEYIIDEVVHGKMIESVYKKDGDEYVLDKEHFRQKGERISSYCLKGAPHSVIASEGVCVTLCLVFGKNKMIYL